MFHEQPYHGEVSEKKGVIGFCRTRAMLLRGVAYNVLQEDMSQNGALSSLVELILRTTDRAGPFSHS
jgi:hypothetical protein